MQNFLIEFQFSHLASTINRPYRSHQGCQDSLFHDIIVYKTPYRYSKCKLLLTFGTVKGKENYTERLPDCYMPASSGENS